MSVLPEGGPPDQAHPTTDHPVSASPMADVPVNTKIAPMDQTCSEPKPQPSEEAAKSEKQEVRSGPGTTAKARPSKKQSYTIEKLITESIAGLGEVTTLSCFDRRFCC